MSHPRGTRTLEKVRAYEELWFLTLRQPWASLALVPGDEQTSVGEIARGLAEVGRQQQGRTIEILAPDLDQLQVSRELKETLIARRARLSEGPQVLVSLEPIVTRPAGVAAALAADMVVLCLEHGKTRLKTAQKTMEMIGRDRISGCILINR